MSLRRVEIMEARAKLEELIASGEEIIIMRKGIELARLTPISPAAIASGPKEPGEPAQLDEPPDAFDLMLEEVIDEA